MQRHRTQLCCKDLDNFRKVNLSTSGELFYIGSGVENTEIYNTHVGRARKGLMKSHCLWMLPCTYKLCL